MSFMIAFGAVNGEIMSMTLTSRKKDRDCGDNQ